MYCKTRHHKNIKNVHLKLPTDYAVRLVVVIQTNVIEICIGSSLRDQTRMLILSALYINCEATVESTRFFNFKGLNLGESLNYIDKKFKAILFNLQDMEENANIKSKRIIKAELILMVGIH